MTLELLFWIIYLLALVFGFWAEYVPGQAYPWPRGFRHIAFFVLIAILGIRVFGGPIKN